MSLFFCFVWFFVAVVGCLMAFTLGRIFAQETDEARRTAWLANGSLWLLLGAMTSVALNGTTWGLLAPCTTIAEAIVWVIAMTYSARKKLSMSKILSTVTVALLLSVSTVGIVDSMTTKTEDGYGLSPEEIRVVSEFRLEDDNSVVFSYEGNKGVQEVSHEVASSPFYCGEEVAVFMKRTTVATPVVHRISAYKQTISRFTGARWEKKGVIYYLEVPEGIVRYERTVAA